MAQVNPNEVATAGIQVLQAAIAELDALKQQPDPDLGRIDAWIDALQARQATLRDQVLRTIEASPDNRQAIAAMTTTAASLKAEAAAMQATAADLTSVAKVVTAATALVAALAPFI